MSEQTPVPNNFHDLKLIREPQLRLLIGLSRSCIYSLLKSGNFPRPLRVGRRAIAWKVSDIASWLEQLKAQGGK